MQRKLASISGNPSIALHVLPMTNKWNVYLVISVQRSSSAKKRSSAQNMPYVCKRLTFLNAKKNTNVQQEKHFNTTCIIL